MNSHFLKWGILCTVSCVVLILLFFMMFFKQTKESNPDPFASNVHTALVYADDPLAEASKQYMDDLLSQAKADHLTNLLKEDPEAGLLKLHSKAAAGSAEAMYLLGTVYYHGTGVEIDYATAFDWFSRAAEMHYAESYTAIGLMYYFGTGIEADLASATKFFEAAASIGCDTALIFLSALYMNEPSSKQKSLSVLKSAVDAGNTDAMCLYAYYHLEGLGVEQNISEGIRWYTQAAENENVFATKTLGDLYLEGIYVPVDYKTAHDWYQKTILSDSKDWATKSEALNQLGCMYSYGLGCTQSYKKANDLFEQAATYGDSNGMYNLACSYYLSLGVEQDYAQAFDLFFRSAMLGDPESMRFLGSMYALGQYVEQDYQEAFKWLKAAAENDSPAGMYLLGQFYLHGWGVSANQTEGILWIQKACDSNYPHAMDFLARVYLTGSYETKPDSDQGMSLLYAAASLNYEPSIELLNQILEASNLAYRYQK